MPSTFTTRLRLEKQADGENPNTWGTRINQNVIDLVDDAIGAYTTVVVSSADVTLTNNSGSSDEARSPFLELSGTVSASLNIEIPAVSKGYVVNNKTTEENAATITIKVAGGAGVVIPNGAVQYVFSDGASVYDFNSIPFNLTATYARLSASNTFTSVNTFTTAVGFETSISATDGQFNSVSVSTATINDASFLKQVDTPPVTLTDAASVALDLQTGNHFILVLGGNRTLQNPTNAKVGQIGHIYIQQDGTGNRTLSFGNAYKFIGGTAPTFSTSISSVDMVVYSVRAASVVDVITNLDFK